MALFNFFKKADAQPASAPVAVPEHSFPTFKEEESLTAAAPEPTPVPAPVQQDAEPAPKASKPLTVSCATGWPIDIIYGYLHKNYEEKGYADAMLNSNLTFRDMNMTLIRNKILMIFREINIQYDEKRRDLITRMRICNEAGLLTSVAELERQMEIIVSHKDELAALEQEFTANGDKTSVPLLSYECGFIRGVSAIAMTSPTAVNSPKIEMPSAARLSAVG